MNLDRGLTILSITLFISANNSISRHSPRISKRKSSPLSAVVERKLVEFSLDLGKLARPNRSMSSVGRSCALLLVLRVFRDRRSDQILNKHTLTQKGSRKRCRFRQSSLPPTASLSPGLQRQSSNPYGRSAG